ncbi:FAD-dependent oxidoreductase [Shouchella patagoniensis]|uniref:FAD-dependent oxidoreductase n=1 Tax=Shouchella patagoniensis TaxID=228576 RepID=UPI0009952182|nr:FAD-dependent oxidoreductase [Shouchella patagoniensis]
MSFLKDSLSILKKNELTFVKKETESENIYRFHFEMDEPFTWKAGQHGLFTITHKKIKDSTRPLTVASSPTENVIKVTTKISEQPSEFKKALLELENGMKIRMNGPVGSFYLTDRSPTLFIAGGIGITPFRAMVKQLESEGKGTNDVTLLYVDHHHLYKDELVQISASTSVDVCFLHSREELHPEINHFVRTYQNRAHYFIAGSKEMVKSVNQYLKDHSISVRNIKKDTFTGY